jgi:CarD family transcriptional regulator
MPFMMSCSLEVKTFVTDTGFRVGGFQRMMTFAVGEKVVYPNQGVGTIENISIRLFAQRPEKFYLLRLICSSMTVMVPFANAETIGLRRLSKATDVNRVFLYLSGPAVPDDLCDWKLRFKVNSEKMLTGSLIQIAEVFKQLVRLQMEKPLSFREKKMLDRTRSMLISEVSIARNIPQPEAIVLLERALAKCGFAFPEAA